MNALGNVLSFVVSTPLPGQLHCSLRKSTATLQRPIRHGCSPRRATLLHATASEEQPPRAAGHPALQTHARALLTGLTASTLGSLVGAGGGVVLTPLLTATAGLRQQEAHGTSLCVVAATAVISAARYGLSAAADPSAAVALAAAALFTAPVGARASARTDAGRLKRFFGAFLIAVSGLIPALPYISGGDIELHGVVRAGVLLGLGAVTGFLSGLLGIGGGTINVPALGVLAGFPQALAQGTAMLAMILPSLRGAFAHIRLKHVAVNMLPGLFVGAITGGFLGSSVALSLPERTLRVVCSIIFAAIGVRYMMPKPARK